MKGNVFWERDFFGNPSFCAEGILKLVRKSSPSHQRVTDYRNSSGKRYQRVKKNLQVQIRATNSDLSRNRLLGFNVSWYTEIVLENVLCGSRKPQVHSKSWGNYLLGINVSPSTETVLKNVLSGSRNRQVQSKPSYRPWFATKSSLGHQRVELNRNSPQKRT